MLGDCKRAGCGCRGCDIEVIPELAQLFLLQHCFHPFLCLMIFSSRLILFLSWHKVKISQEISRTKGLTGTTEYWRRYFCDYRILPWIPLLSPSATLGVEVFPACLKEALMHPLAQWVFCFDFWGRNLIYECLRLGNLIDVSMIQIKQKILIDLVSKIPAVKRIFWENLTKSKDSSDLLSNQN